MPGLHTEKLYLDKTKTSKQTSNNNKNNPNTPKEKKSGHGLDMIAQAYNLSTINAEAEGWWISYLWL